MSTIARADSRTPSGTRKGVGDPSAKREKLEEELDARSTGIGGLGGMTLGLRRITGTGDTLPPMALRERVRDVTTTCRDFRSTKIARPKGRQRGSIIGWPSSSTSQPTNSAPIKLVSLAS